MKRITIAIILLLAGAIFSYATTKEIQFRLVLTEEEAKTVTNQKYEFVPKQDQKPESILIGKDVFLTNKDIQGIAILKDYLDPAKNYPLLDIAFTKEGSLKLKEVTEKNLRKQLAILVDNEILMVPYIVFPLKSGHIKIKSWKIPTNEAAKNFVKDLGFSTEPRQQ